MIAYAESLRVVLASPRNPLNIGAAARAMSNFGFFRLRVVNAYEVAYAEARSAVNATAVLEESEQFSSLADAVRDCGLVVGTTAGGGRDLVHTLRPLEEGCALIREAMADGPVALLFGSEKYGLSNDDLSHAHWLMRIPTREGHPSMNLGQAVAICLYEMIREQTRTSDRKEPRAADGEARERFLDRLSEVLRESGYTQGTAEESTQLKLRRLVQRMNLSAHDAPVWLGILRQISWKIRQGSGTSGPDPA